jgi:hypothetical protein
MNSLFNSVAQPKMLRLNLRNKIEDVSSKYVCATLDIKIWRNTCSPTYQAFEWHDILEDLLIDKTQ